MPSSLAVADRACGDGGELGADGVPAGVNGDVSQGRLLRLEDHLEQVPIHHGFWPLLYLKYVYSHKDDLLHLHPYVAAAGEPCAAKGEVARLDP